MKTNIKRSMLVFSMICLLAVSSLGLTHRPAVGQIAEQDMSPIRDSILSNVPLAPRFQHRYILTIDHQAAASINYQVKIQITDANNPVFPYFSPATHNGILYLGASDKVQTDYSDILFFDNDGLTKLDYWLEKVESDTPSINHFMATVWVEVKDDLSSSDVTIYFMCGDEDAISESNGDDTFIFFDDFSGDDIDLDKWDVTEYAQGSGSNSYEVTNGELHISATSSSWKAYRGYGMFTDDTFGYGNSKFTVKGRWSGLDYHRGGGTVLQASEVDDQSEWTTNRLFIWGDYRLYCMQYADSVLEHSYNMADVSSGTFMSVMDLRDTVDWTVALSGTYSNTETGTYGESGLPFQLYLASMICYWTNPVSMDTYWDTVILQKSVDSPPELETVIYDYDYEESLEAIDVMVVFDAEAYQWIKTKTGADTVSEARTELHDIIEDALNHVYGAIGPEWNLIDDPDWIIYDAATMDDWDFGDYDLDNMIDFYAEWRAALWYWDYTLIDDEYFFVSDVSSAEAGIHGDNFDILIMLTSHGWSTGGSYIGGTTSFRGSFTMLSLYDVNSYLWSEFGIIWGLKTLVCHEVAHMFAIDDDLYSTDIMSYTYSAWYPYSQMITPDNIEIYEFSVWNHCN